MTTRRNDRSRGVLATVIGCVVTTALLAAGPASAASRGFKLHNESNHALILEAAKTVPNTPMDFEGRPANGAELKPGHTHDWELKYGFRFFGGVRYAANLWYRIAGSDANVEYTIETWSTSNESSCRVYGAAHGTCTAAGTKLTFKDK